jgi:hypothetical protein
MSHESAIPEKIKNAEKLLSEMQKVRANFYTFTTRWSYFIMDHITFPYRQQNVLDWESITGIDVYSSFNRYIAANYADGYIEGFTSLSDIYRRRPVKAKAGKFIRKIFPFMTDSEVEKAVQNLKEQFSPLEFDIVMGNDAESFRYAYVTEHTPKRSPKFERGDYYPKRLDCSCMRGDNFEGWKQHPAEAYAHSDLAIVYAKQKGKDYIGARVIVWPDKKTCQSIYTADDEATRVISEYLKANGYKESGIRGAKMSKIHYRGDYYLMPYIDGEDFVEDCEDHFVIGQGGIALCGTSGRVSVVPMAYCDDCGDMYEESELESINGECYCPSCRYNNLIWSDLMDSYVRRDEVCESGNGDIATSDYFESNGYVIDYRGTYQDESECVEFDDEYYHNTDHYIKSVDGEYYHEDSDEYQTALDLKARKDAAYQTITTIQFGWTQSMDWNCQIPKRTPHMGIVTTQERVLRDNYQLDENGIPERLPEFDFA